MTPAAPSVFDRSMARAAEHHQIEMWRAAETVRSHVQPAHHEELLECLGLSDVPRPAGL